MNTQVTEFIEKQKKQCLARKNNHLIRLGLIDLDKTEKRYASENMLDWQREEEGYVNQDEKGYYKFINPIALSVTDEEYAEICRYCPPEKNMTAFEKQMLEQIDVLRKMMKFFMIVTIIGLVISFIAGLIVVLD